MTRKPQQSGPTAEDISRHEEAVAKYLCECSSDALKQRWAGLLPSEKLALMLGIQTVSMSLLFHKSGEPDMELGREMAQVNQWLDFQIRLERTQGLA